MMKAISRALIVTVALVATMADAFIGREKLYNEYRSQEMLKIRARIAALGQGPEAVFTSEQAEQIRAALECHPKACKRFNQITLEAAAKSVGRVEEQKDFETIIEWQVRFCRAVELDKLLSLVEETFGQHMSDELASNDKCNAVCRYFSAIPELDARGSEIGNKMSEIDANKAEEILSGATRVTSKVAVELLKKIGPNRYSYALGDVGKLIQVFETSESVCQLNQLHFIVGKALQFRSENSALRPHLQSLASNQFKVCNEESAQMQDPIAERVPAEKVELVRDFVRQVVEGQLFDSKQENLFTNFHNIVELIKTNSREKGADTDAYKSYGEPLAESCDSVLRSFEDELKLYDAFIVQPAKSKSVWEFLNTIEICKLVPSRFNFPRLINRHTNIRLGEPFSHARDLARLLAESSSKSKPTIERLVKSLGKLAEFLSRKESSKERKNLRVELVDQLEQLCDSPARKSLLWMARAHYPTASKHFVSDLEEVETSCDSLNSVGFAVVREKLGEKKSLTSKLKSKFN